MKARTIVAVAAALAVVTATVLVPSAARADTVQTTTWDFDSAAVGSIPANCTTPAGRTPIPVTDAKAPAGSTHSVVLTETGSAVPILNCVQSPTASASLSFQVYPQQLTHGFMVDLMGTSTTGAQTSPLTHVYFTSGGVVQWYDGSTWHTLAGSGGPALGQWSSVQVSVAAATNTVNVAVNGVALGFGGSWALNPLTSFTGFQFAGGGTPYTGDVVYFGSATLTGSAPVHAASWNLDASAAGAVPANCATPANKAALTVSSTVAVPGSSHSLQLTESGSAQPIIQCTPPAGNTLTGVGADLRFTVNPQQMAWGFMVDLMGSSTAGAQSLPLFHILFNADGSVQWYQGYDATTWMPLAASGGPAIGQWSTIEIGTTADMDMTYVTVNGHYLGSGGSWTINPTTRVTGFQFAGTGTTRTGDVIYFGSPGLFPALPDRPAAVTSQYGIDATTTIASEPGSTTSPWQMPNTAVQVPAPSGGNRILADYPTHADAANASGNAFIYSDDGGATWQHAPATPTPGEPTNPMPTAQSFNLSRLADGSLLAVNYHTYAQLDGTILPSNEGAVQSAVSTDNGQTWTVRSGIMTAPQAIAPYGCEVATGCTALVVVHSVIQDAGGTLYQSAYGRYAADASGTGRQIVLTSTDGGLTWTVRATVAAPSSISTAGFVEGAIAWGSSGTMIAVMRTTSYNPMYISRSTDSGVTWSTPQKLIGADGAPVISIYPDLVKLGDGSLLLKVGRPGMSILRSTDGGATWSRQVWVDYNDSGNGVIAGLGGNRVIMLGDRGQDWLSPIPQTMGIWSKTITVN